MRVALLSATTRSGYLFQGDKELKCKIVRYLKRRSAIFSIEGIADRSQAEKLKGLFLYIKRSELPETDTNEFYVCDLVGKRVEVAGNGSATGIVSDVFNFGAGDLLEISTENAKFLVPFTEENFPTGEAKDASILMSGDAWNWYS